MQVTARINHRAYGEHRSRAGRWALAVASILIACVALPYLLIDQEPDRMDRDARLATPGHFLRLSAGHTHYREAGPVDGEVVVLVHGTTVPSFVWDHNVHALAAAGYRAVRYDLYGRGYSDRPERAHDLDLYVEQLDELLQQVAPARPVNLVGLSIGGVIVAEFARRHPERVSKLTLVDPAGVGTELPLVAKVAMAPGVGEYLMRVAGGRLLRPSRRMLLHPEKYPEIDEIYLETIRFKGSRQAVLESLRRLPYNGYAAGYEQVGLLGKPVLLIWGRHDTVVPFASSTRVCELIRPTRFVPVMGAGHLANYEQPGVVNDALIEFLSLRHQPVARRTSYRSFPLRNDPFDGVLSFDRTRRRVC